MQVHWMDILILIVLVGTLIGGIGTGLIKQALSLVILLSAVYLAGQFYGVGADLAEIFTSDYDLGNLVGFAVAFGVVSVGLSIVLELLVGRKRVVSLGWGDHLAGGLLGLATGAVFTATALIVLATYPVGGVDIALAESGFAPHVLERADFVFGLLPEVFRGVQGGFGV